MQSKDKTGQQFLMQLRCIDGKVKGTIWDIPPGLPEHLEKYGPMLIGFRFHPNKIGEEQCSKLRRRDDE